MPYLDNAFKRAGKENEPKILKLILDFLTSRGYSVTAEQATINEDMSKKIDYKLIFKEKPFTDGDFIVPIDVKYGLTFTTTNALGEKYLDNCTSKYIVFHNHKGNELIWVDVKRLRECVTLNPPIEIQSKDYASKYIWIKDFINTHREFLGKKVSIVKTQKAVS